MKRLELQNTNRPLDVILHWHQNRYLELDPPYQRGDVWGFTRRRSLIKSLLQGVPIASLIINDRTRNYDAWGKPEEKFMAVIDGKQRITTILMFFDNQFSVPANWFNHGEGWIAYQGLPSPLQRRFKNLPIGVSEGSIPDLAGETEVFELVNFGGVPQGQSDTGEELP